MAHSDLYIRLMNSRYWRALRAQQLTRQPECQACAERGLHVAAQCVHHIVPVESGRTDTDCTRLAYSPSNLMSLCFACHSDIHKADRSHSKEAHQERGEARLSAWAARREEARASEGGCDETPGGDFFGDPHRLPNPLRLPSVDGDFFENSVFPNDQRDESEETDRLMMTDSPAEEGKKQNNMPRRNLTLITIPLIQPDCCRDCPLCGWVPNDLRAGGRYDSYICVATMTWLSCKTIGNLKSEQDPRHPMHRPCDDKYIAWSQLPRQRFAVGNEVYNTFILPMERQRQTQLILKFREQARAKRRKKNEENE